MPIRLGPAELVIVLCLICGGGLAVIAAAAALVRWLVRKQ